MPEDPISCTVMNPSDSSSSAGKQAGQQAGWADGWAWGRQGRAQPSKPSRRSMTHQRCRPAGCCQPAAVISLNTCTPVTNSPARVNWGSCHTRSDLRYCTVPLPTKRGSRPGPVRVDFSSK